MSSVAKIKGTSVGSFTIGVKGVTLYQGTNPSGITPNEGDIFIQTGTTPNFLQYNGTEWMPFKPVPIWQEITSNTTVTANTKYFVNTSNGEIRVTLPASPSMGDTVTLVDAVGTFQTNNLVIDTNGSNYQANPSSSTITATASGMTVDLVYYNQSYGWTLLNQSSISGLNVN